MHPRATRIMISGATMTPLEMREPTTIQSCGAGNSLQHRWRSTSLSMTLVSIISVLLVRRSTSTAVASATAAAPAGAGRGRGHCRSSSGSCSQMFDEFAGWRRGLKRQFTSKSSGRSTTTESQKSGRSRERSEECVVADGPAVDPDCANGNCGECLAD